MTFTINNYRTIHTPAHGYYAEDQGKRKNKSEQLKKGSVKPVSPSRRRPRRRNTIGY